MRRPFAAAALVLVLSAVGPSLFAEVEPRRILRQPSLSAEAIAFVFAGDLWTVARGGGEATRLTADVGFEQDPVFSPDGKWLAFSGEYDGNVDLFVMPAAGGAPRRLTWHPGPDRPVAWTRDGARILFRTSRDSATNDQRLFSIPAAGGWPERLPLPEAFAGSYSPDGRRLAYMPHERYQLAWKRYRGGESTFVWLVDLATLEVSALPRGNSNDAYPSWAEDGRVYFLSDRDGTVTLFQYDPTSEAVARVFTNDGLDLKNAQAGPGAIVFERFGEIGLYDLASGAVAFPAIRVTSDLEGIRSRWAKVGGKVTAAALSPTGARAAFAARGELFTVPAEKGVPRNLTRSPGAADRDPAWSPDGRFLAWLSDESGEYALHLAQQDGLGTPRRLALGEPASFFYAPLWSPDGERIALHDKRLNLWTVAVDDGKRTLVDSGSYDVPWRTLDPAWSPDGRWLAYTKRLPSHFHAVFVHDTRTGLTRQVTDGLADARYPAFDAGGKHLWFTVSTDWGPSAPWLDMTSVEHPVSRSVWLAVLPGGEPSPFPPESDEENEKKAEDDGGKGADGDGKKGATKKDGKTPEVDIAFAGLERRIVPVPGVPARNYQALAAGKAGEIFLLESPEVPDADAEDGGSGALSKFTIEGRKLEKLADQVSFVRVSKGGEKLLVRSGEDWSIVGSAGPIEAGKGKLPIADLETRVDPPAEWRQMFRETWRLERDFFYDPRHHGLDLAAAEAKYASWVDGLAHRADLNYLFQEMLGELTVGHLYVGGGDLPEPPKVTGGLLGADWEIADGRYRLTRVLDGERWNPELEAPLARPGVDARAGEFLIAVEGREVRPPASIHSFFEATSGRQVRIRLAADAAGRSARDVVVVPVANERALRYRAWVEDNRRAVERLSDGRLGYVHLPNTAGAGFSSFNRYYFAQTDRQGMVVDERNNGGGLIADYFVDVLSRTPLWGVAARDGRDMLSPAGALYGPKAMLINRHAGSGGDALPWMFRKLAIGPLVGTRTWGGLVGIWDYPQLLDGGAVTAPRGALYTLDGSWQVENLGVAPDFEIEITPQDFAAGRDPQLEKGVALLLEELARGARPQPVRPPFPDYQVTPWQSEARP